MRLCSAVPSLCSEARPTLISARFGIFAWPALLSASVFFLSWHVFFSQTCLCCGIRAEDIKACDDESKEMVRQIFNEIIKQNEFTPEVWKKVKIKVLHKRDDVENVGNYRPICSLPALYKLLSTILFGRLYPRLDQKQAEDQAGFRKSYQTTDHLATYRMIEQKCHEWRIKMWTATIDFTKAFHSITLNSIWKALKSCGIKRDYISLLRNIHKDQKASVLTD